jgi:hypothetical protein
MQYLVIPNFKNYINTNILGWTIQNFTEYSSVYVIVLNKDDSEKLFHIHREIIKANALRLDEDVYELRYKNFEDSLLLNSTDILDMNIVVSKMEELIQKYSSYE